MRQRRQSVAGSLVGAAEKALPPVRATAFSQALVIGEIAVTLVLLVGAGLLLRSCVLLSLLLLPMLIVRGQHHLLAITPVRSTH